MTTAHEPRRIELQAERDGKKTQAERNRLGQFATPTSLARDVLDYGLAQLKPGCPIHFLDPAFGTGAFYSALRAAAGAAQRPIASARGIELDPHYAEPAQALWRDTPLRLEVADFTRLPTPDETDKANLLICNPPYVRHHHLARDEKCRLQTLSSERVHIRLSGLAGLYCHFMALAHGWMDEGGVAGWLIPSEFMDVNYGRALQHYLLNEVTLLHIHRFDPNDVQFDDALVSSAVVWFRKCPPPAGHSVVFSFGGRLSTPAISKRVAVCDLEGATKWTRYPEHAPDAKHQGFRLGDLFEIKRGIATGCNDFFILDEAQTEALQLPSRFLRPVLPSARHLTTDHVKADPHGLPLLEKRRFLLDCELPEATILSEYPTLWMYLQTGLERVASRYVCRNRRTWYTQEQRLPAPIVCTYLGRSDRNAHPFRFIRNESAAIATNVYLMLYPKPELAKQLEHRPGMMQAIWQALNAIPAQTLLGNGRVYGGGLHKLEPRELANVPANSIAALAGLLPKQQVQQFDLFDMDRDQEASIDDAPSAAIGMNIEPMSPQQPTRLSLNANPFREG